MIEKVLDTEFKQTPGYDFRLFDNGDIGRISYRDQKFISTKNEQIVGNIADKIDFDRGYLHFLSTSGSVKRLRPFYYSELESYNEDIVNPSEIIKKAQGSSMIDARFTIEELFNNPQYNFEEWSVQSFAALNTLLQYAEGIPYMTWLEEGNNYKCRKDAAGLYHSPSYKTPAFFQDDGRKEWFFHGVRHRLGGPAVEYADGSEEWYLSGRRHREGGPAFISSQVSKYYSHGLLHRVNGPAIEYSNGKLEYFVGGSCVDEEIINKIKAGEIRCDVSPFAVRWYKWNGENWVHHSPLSTIPSYWNRSSGCQVFYLNGKAHCDFGPAVIGNLQKEYWLYGHKLENREEWERWKRNNIQARKTCSDGVLVEKHVRDDHYMWYKLGTYKLHNVDEPAYERSDGKQEWWAHNRLHRENGPAASNSLYCLNGVYLGKEAHRQAVEGGYEPRFIDNKIMWFLKGTEKLHHPTKPADGENYFLNGVKVSKRDHEIAAQHNILPYQEGQKTVWRLSNGRAHNPEGPTVQRADGSCSYLLNGYIFNEDEFDSIKKQGLEIIIDGPDKSILLLGKRNSAGNFIRHNETGPAVFTRDGFIWYKEGRPHRSDGPSHCINGISTWSHDGFEFGNKEEWEEYKMNLDQKLNEIKNSVADKLDDMAGSIHQSRLDETIANKLQKMHSKYKEAEIDKKAVENWEITKNKYNEAVEEFKKNDFWLDINKEYDRLKNEMREKNAAQVGDELHQSIDKEIVDRLKDQVGRDIPKIEFVPIKSDDGTVVNYAGETSYEDHEKTLPEEHYPEQKEVVAAHQGEMGMGGAVGMMMAGSLLAGMLAKGKKKKTHKVSQKVVERKEQIEVVR